MPTKTPFFKQHEKLHPTMANFHCWQLPLYYSTPLAEYNAVRQRCGLFDTSHMGLIQVEGKEAEQLLQSLLVRNVAGMRVGKMKLAVMCNANGGMLDDLTVYKFSGQKFWLVVNAAPYESDLNWVSQNSKQMDAIARGLRRKTAKLDLQGPKAQQVLQKLDASKLNEIKYYNFREAEISAIGCVVSRSGYTGEDGFEIYFDAQKAGEMWNALFEAGKEFGLQACGLAARDLLRLEAGMLLYGQDMDEGKTPLQCYYRKLIDWEKRFIGRAALAKQRAQGVKEKLVGFELLERGIARNGSRILKKGKEIGIVTSGSFSPTLKKGIGLGYIGREFSAAGTEFEIEIRGKAVKAKVAKLPFYRRGD